MLPLRVTLQALTSSSPTITAAASTDQPRRNALPPAGFIPWPPCPSSIWWMLHLGSKRRVRRGLRFLENFLCSGSERSEEAVQVSPIVIGVERQPEAAFAHGADDASRPERLLQSIGLDPVMLQRENARSLAISV